MEHNYFYTRTSELPTTPIIVEGEVAISGVAVTV